MTVSFKHTTKRIIAIIISLLLVASFSYIIVDADDNASFDKYTVSTVNPLGLTMNLFDYTVTENGENDNNKDYFSKTKNLGINEDHEFKFNGGNSYGTGYINQNENDYATQGIVKSTLDGGFPVLNQGNAIASEANDSIGTNIIQTDESLGYLFDSTEYENKKTYSNVKGLLQIDDNGYYYYDSHQNYASYDESTNNFKVYNAPGARSSRNATAGQFFPFNSAGDAFYIDTTADSLKVHNSNEDVANPWEVNNNKWNHYFGLTMTTGFVQPTGGTVKNEPMTFSFSGDDDVWVFIDDVLVIDIGGIHGVISGAIDFSTGQVEVGKKDDNGDFVSDGTYNYQNTTLKEMFEAAGVSTDNFDADTFSDDSYHTLSMFYLERGNTASNLSLSFNLNVVTQDTLTKIDENGRFIYNAGFTLYEKSDYELNGENAEALTSVTANGTVTLRDADGKRLQLVKDNEYVLVETSPPEGYISIKNTPIELVCVASDQSGNGLLQVTEKSRWETGAYGAITVTLSITGAKLADGSTVDIGSGALFAVPMHQSNGTWKPVSGTITNGYTVEENAFTAFQNQVLYGHGGMFSAIATASEELEETVETNSDTTDETFDVNYDAVLSQLPGEYSEYCWETDHTACDGACTYRLGFYFATSETDVQEVSVEGLEYVFNTELYVPNTKKEFSVKKVIATKDDDGNYVNTDTPMQYAEFTLYKEDTDSQLVEYDSAVTDENGLLSFPTGSHVLSDGTYYLVETKAPAGYGENPESVKVVVSDTGVFINTGDDGDGIDVSIHPELLVTTMRQYAIEEQPLNNITVTYKTADVADETPFDEVSNWVEGDVCKLKYSENGLYTDADGGTSEHNHVVSSGYVTYNITSDELSGISLNNLYTKYTLVTVGNVRETGTLAIYQQIQKIDNDYLDTKDFTYEISFYSNNDISFTEATVGYTIKQLEYSSYNISLVDDNVQSGTVDFTFSGTTSSSFTFKLKALQFIEFTDVPAGLWYAVKQTEGNENGYKAGYYTWRVLEPTDSYLWETAINKGGTKKYMLGAMTSSDGTEVNGYTYNNWIKQITDSTSGYNYIESGAISNARMVNEFDRTFTFNKVDLLDNSKALQNVGFTLFPAKGANRYYDVETGEWTEEAMKIEAYSVTTSSPYVSFSNRNSIWVSWPDAENGYRFDDVLTTVSSSTGVVTLADLSAGCYRLVEYKTADGYKLPDGQWNIFVPDDGSDIVITAVNTKSDGTTVDLPPAFKLTDDTYYLPNYKPLDIPTSGGQGALMCLVIGMIMIMGGALLFIISRKRNRIKNRCGGGY